MNLQDSANNKAILVLSETDDARRLLTSGHSRYPILGLTPAVRAILSESGNELINPRAYFDDDAQAKVIAAVRTARKQFFDQFEQKPEYNPVTREMVRVIFDRAAYNAMRLYHSLGSAGPWRIPDGDGWSEIIDRDSAAYAATRKLFAPYVARGLGGWHYDQPPLPPLYRGLRWLLTQVLKTKKDLVVTSALKEEFGVLRALANRNDGSRLVVMQICDSGLREYLRLVRSIWRAVSGNGIITLGLLSHDVSKSATEHSKTLVERCADCVGNGPIKNAFRQLAPNLARSLAVVPELMSDANDVVGALGPAINVEIENANLTNWIVADACGRSGVERIVVGRNGHAPVANDHATDSAFRYFRARFPADMTDVALVWTPAMLASAQQTFATQPRLSLVRFDAGKTLSATAEPKRTRQVLLVDSYADWIYPQSWIYQTSDEYLDGARELIRAIERISNIRLVIRAKNKRECGEDDLNALLNPPPNCHIKIRDIPIQQDLLESDLVVGFRSTALDEALHARRPVLLWGATNRYRYFPARKKLPRPGDRAAIYSVEEPEQLSEMIEAILEVHAGRQLSDDELEGIIWPDVQLSAFAIVMKKLIGTHRTENTDAVR